MSEGTYVVDTGREIADLRRRVADLEAQVRLLAQMQTRPQLPVLGPPPTLVPQTPMPWQAPYVTCGSGNISSAALQAQQQPLMNLRNADGR